MGSNQYPSIAWTRDAVKGKMGIKYPFHISEYAHSMGKMFENSSEENDDGDITEVKAIQKMLSAINKNDLSSLKEYFERKSAK